MLWAPIRLTPLPPPSPTLLHQSDQNLLVLLLDAAQGQEPAEPSRMSQKTGPKRPFFSHMRHLPPSPTPNRQES